MALFGALKTLEKQTAEPAFRKVFDYLKTADLATLFQSVAPGKNLIVELEGEDVFGIFQQYVTKPVDQANPEAHRVYTDIQYVYEGEEQIGVADAALVVRNDDYQKEKDILFPGVEWMSMVRLKAGHAAILYPDDVHAPCLAVDQPAEVKKIVFKIKL